MQITIFEVRFTIFEFESSNIKNVSPIVQTKNFASLSAQRIAFGATHCIRRNALHSAQRIAFGATHCAAT